MLTQHMMNKPNTIYVIRYDYCLGGETIKVPENCVLQFEGGSLRNGRLIFDNTNIVNHNFCIFKNISFSGNLVNSKIDIRIFGIGKTEEENFEIINKAISYVDQMGGGEIIIPYNFKYGYNRNKISTHPQFPDFLNNDIIINDFSEGATYDNKEGSREGAQERRFFRTKGNIQDGQHDGAGFILRDCWHPNIIMSNDEDPLKATRRYATIFWGNNGIINWGIGQGVYSLPVDGTNRDDKLSKFKIVGNNIDGNKGLTNMMVIEKNGCIAFNNSSASYDFSFSCSRNRGNKNAVINFNSSNKDGDLVFLLNTKEYSRDFVVSNSEDCVYLTNGYRSKLLNIYGDGRLTYTPKNRGKFEINMKEGAGGFVMTSDSGSSEVRFYSSKGNYFGAIGIDDVNNIIYITNAKSSKKIFIDDVGSINLRELNGWGIDLIAGNPNRLDLANKKIGKIIQNINPITNNRGLYVYVGGGKYNLISGIDSCEKTTRPSNTDMPIGFMTFDTTLNKPIWWTGSSWVDATGTQV